MRKIKHKNPEQIMQFLYSLRSKGVLDKRVLSAMEQIDRAEFIKGPFEERAYDDVPLPISCAQTISQPSIVGLMTQALDVQPRNKVLEIGTGSGYQAAILSKLSRRVYTLDRHAKLTNYVEKLFVRLNINNVVPDTFVLDEDNVIQSLTQLLKDVKDQQNKSTNNMLKNFINEIKSINRVRGN